jgi:hypothetical protein
MEVYMAVEVSTIVKPGKKKLIEMSCNFDIMVLFIKTMP